VQLTLSKTGQGGGVAQGRHQPGSHPRQPENPRNQAGGQPFPGTPDDDGKEKIVQPVHPFFTALRHVQRYLPLNLFPGFFMLAHRPGKNNRFAAGVKENGMDFFMNFFQLEKIKKPPAGPPGKLKENR